MATHVAIYRDDQTYSNGDPLDPLTQMRATLTECDGSTHNVIAVWDGQEFTTRCRCGAYIDVIDTAPSPGYICKRCGMPSPTGVGYVTQAVTSNPDSCSCGYSQRP